MNSGERDEKKLYPFKEKYTYPWMNVRKQSRMYTIIAIPNRIAGTVHVNSNHVAHV